MKVREALPTLLALQTALFAGVWLGYWIHGKTETPPAHATPAAVVVTEPAPIPGLPECPTEDSAGPCNWHGGSNGLGHSFAALPEPGKPVPVDIAKSLSADPGQGGRNWSVCTWYVGDTSWVVCPDGWSASS